MPWSEVFVDGIPIGRTPVLCRIEAGTYQMILRRESLGIKETERVGIKHGTDLRIVRRLKQRRRGGDP